ncbi:MAG: zinc ribbon domain-containing protein, partial [Candidatus Heimdallarchaeota archaeon]
MQGKTCSKCGTANPEKDAQFCYECDNPFPKHDLIDSSRPSTSKICRECRINNPSHATFCYKCGTPLGDVQLQSDLCPTCGITVDRSKLFCPNCGQSLIKKTTLEFKPEAKSPMEAVSPRVECPACGQLTTGEYCRNCGYRLTLQQKKRPIDWWYCDRDSAIMVEIDPNLQIPVSRTSIDESLAQALDNRLLPHQDRKKARQLALQLFEDGGTTNFEVLTPVKCPACGKQSLAPITQKPQDTGFRY